MTENHDQEVTPADMLEAFRTAVAIARAGACGDPEGVGVLFNNAPHKAGVIYELSKLPAQMAQGVASRHGEEIDVDAALAGLLQTLPQTIDPEENA